MEPVIFPHLCSICCPYKLQKKISVKFPTFFFLVFVCASFKLSNEKQYTSGDGRQVVAGLILCNREVKRNSQQGPNSIYSTQLKFNFKMNGQIDRWMDGWIDVCIVKRERQGLLFNQEIYWSCQNRYNDVRYIYYHHP